MTVHREAILEHHLGFCKRQRVALDGVGVIGEHDLVG